VKTDRVFSVSRRTAAPDGSLKARIVEAARDLFFKSGFVRVRADDIAAKLGISKATLYKEFAGKEEILRAVVGRTVAEMAAAVEAIARDDSRDFVEKTIALMTFLKSVISHLRGPLGQDIERYAPAVWKEIDEFRRKMILANFKILIGAGVREGALRGDIDRDVLVLMWVTLVQNLLTPEMIVRLPRSADAVFEIMIKIIFGGLLTDKGRQKYIAQKGPLTALKKEVRP